MNKNSLYLKTLFMSLILLTISVSYGKDGDLDNDGIPDSQEQGVQSPTTAQEAPSQAPSKRERKAQKLEKKAAKKEAKGKGEKAAELRARATEKRNKDQSISQRAAVSTNSGDLDNDGIPDSQEQGNQPSSSAQGSTATQQGVSWREKKAQRLEREAQSLRSQAEGMEGKQADKLNKKAAGREKDAAKLRHIDKAKGQGLSKKEAKRDFKQQWKAQNAPQ